MTLREVFKDEHGVVRFRANSVVRALVDAGIVDLNQVRLLMQVKSLRISDVEEFWQMIGYSISGYGELSFISDESKDAADEAGDRLLNPGDYAPGGMGDPIR